MIEIKPLDKLTQISKAQSGSATLKMSITKIGHNFYSNLKFLAVTNGIHDVRNVNHTDIHINHPEDDLVDYFKLGKSTQNLPQ